MFSRAPQLRQTYVLTGAVVALVVVAGFALLASRRVTTIVERQANERGKDVARHAASLVSLYMRERHREAEALARSPALVQAAVEASQRALSQHLPQLDIGTLERSFSQRRVLVGTPASPATLPITTTRPNSAGRLSPR